MIHHVHSNTQQKKLRKLCLRGYDNTPKTFKNILISQYHKVSIFLKINALFGFVAPIAASKINVKADWSSRHFPQNFIIHFNIPIKHEFSCTNFRHVTLEMLKTHCDRSGG